ncbi:ankyrin repeat-containing domain protein [Scleroderma yunnanense]
MSGVHNAAQNNQLSVVRSLVAENPKLINDDGRTPLHWAASAGATDIVRYLIDQKAEVDKADSSGWTALHIAVSAGNEDIVQELIGAGADINKRNEKGLAPLCEAHDAVIFIDANVPWKIGRFLIQRGADACLPLLLLINAKDKANQLPLHRAATTGSTGFISLLLNPPEGAVTTKPRLNTGDRIGNTPLHLAMESAHAQAAVLLIEGGADRGRTNLEDLTPENVEGVGGEEQARVRQYIIDHCGRP